MLLRLESVHVHGQLSGCDHVCQKDKLPARQLSAIAQVEVLRQRVMLPSPCLFDARFPPQARRAVEVKEASAPAPRRLLQKEMAVEEHRLHPGKQGITSVEVAPSCLNHSDIRVGKKVDRLFQQIRRRNKVGIEDANKFPGGGFETHSERSRLESGPIDPAD